MVWSYRRLYRKVTRQSEFKKVRSYISHIICIVVFIIVLSYHIIKWFLYQKSFHFRCGNVSDDTSCYYNISFLEWISIFGILPGSKKNRFSLEVVGASDPESRPKRLQWGLVGVHYYVYVLFSLNLFPHVYSGSSYDWLSTHCFLNHSVLGNEEGIELLSLLNKFNSSVCKSKPLNKFSGFFLSPLASLSSTIAFDLWYSASSFSIPSGMVVANKINVESFSYLIIQSIDALSFGQLIANRMVAAEHFTEQFRSIILTIHIFFFHKDKLQLHGRAQNRIQELFHSIFRFFRRNFFSIFLFIFTLFIHMV